MRIIIDIQGLQGGSRQRGIGRYTQSFVEAFIHQSVGDEVYLLLNMLLPDAETLKTYCETLVPKKHIIPFYAVAPAREVYPSNMWNIQASEYIREKMITDLHADFVIVTSLFEGLTDNSIISIGEISNTPTATILYDLIPSVYPDEFLTNPLKKSWYERKIKSLKKSDILLSISNSASDEAIKYLNFPIEKIQNISAASDIGLKDFKKNNTLKETYHITKPFLLHTSAYEPRKNFEGLIEAFGLMEPVLRKQYQLVLVCKLKPEQRTSLEHAIDEAKLEKDEVILTDYVEDDLLISLYHSCYLFVFPSFHEGFGLPALEAMSCGAATIGSNVSSIPEVIGREDALFDPYDAKNICEKITEVLTQKDFYQSLKQSAKKQASHFTWESSAKKALEALKAYSKMSHYTPPTHSLETSTQNLIGHLASLRLKDLRPLDASLMQAAKAISYNEERVSLLHSHQHNRACWRIEGPFDSSYSLALLNRETALALSALGYHVILHSTDGPGDYTPSQTFLEHHPFLATLYRHTFHETANQCSTSSRNLYPPRVADMQTKTRMLHHYAWEESAFPSEWVEDFNTHLTAMTCLSSHVEKIMIDNGVTVPLLTSGCGVDHWERIVPDANYHLPLTGFTFLHVSSCFPRKGVDVLLQAYAQSFSSTDNVTLVIKTFKNPHNTIEDLLQTLQKENPDFPKVHLIQDDLTDEELKALYGACDVLVAPSRAEGFGLPMAEAMLSGLAVITTGWGGQLDFCNKENAWLIEYHFTRAKTHFALHDSVWAEPSVSHLASLMQLVSTLPKTKRLAYALRGRKQLLKAFKWTDVTQRLIEAKTLLHPSETTPRIGWISTWNSKCGIASYSEHILHDFPAEVSILADSTSLRIKEDTTQVYRCWKTGDGEHLENLIQEIHTLKLDTLVIQFNYSFYDFGAFKHFLTQMHKEGKTIVIMFHATTDSPLTPHKKLSMLKDVLQNCDRLFVHTPDDLNRLKALGMVDNVALFPHGVVNFTKKEKTSSSTFILASYGFFLPHKGLLELIETVHLLHSKGHHVKLHMINALYPVAISKKLVEDAQARIKEYALDDDITLITDYLSDEASLTHLSHADLLIFPYQETGESSSAAVRYGLASHTPVAVTPLKIFEDVQNATFTLSGTTPEAMAESIAKLIPEISGNSKSVQLKQAEADQWCDAHQYHTLGKRIYQILSSLHQKKSTIHCNDAS